jgi:lipid II:glycine glycyltransferase (peptidoglycan interpeptide bridge formation enzyme)
VKVETITDPSIWNDILRTLPTAHVLQTWEWGEFKRVTTGWQPERFAFRGDDSLVISAASVLTRRAGPLAVMYVPKGPALDYTNPDHVKSVLDHLQAMAKERRAIWLKIDPDVIAATGVPGEGEDTDDGQRILHELRARGWRYSGDQVQFPNTITLDLSQSEDDLLMGMSQNTRRKVRTAMKKGVTVRSGGVDDLDTLYALYQVTGQRDEFLIRPPAYYERAWRDFLQAGLAHALIAEYEGQPIAHVILFHFGTRCWYFYGASSNEERQRMPNYLLQWEAIRWAKAQGYATYDFWGAPTHFIEDDPMWGVYGFKRGFRGTVTRHIGAWDYAPNALLYRVYTGFWPRLRDLMRRLKS